MVSGVILTQCSAEVTLQQHLLERHQHVNQSRLFEQLFNTHTRNSTLMQSYQTKATCLCSCVRTEVSCTSEQLCALRARPAERPLLLLEEEVRLVRGQAAEVSSRGEVEPQLPGGAQARLSEGQQHAVGALLADCKGARASGDQVTDFKHFRNNHIYVFSPFGIVPVARTSTTLLSCPF